MRKCPKCSAGGTKVLETRDTRLATRRRRECRQCKHRYTTYELPVFALVAAEASPASEPMDAGEIADHVASEVSSQLDEISDRIDGLPAEVLEAFLDEAEARQGTLVSVGAPLELEAGDDSDDDSDDY